jgi:hypothetical protein
MTAPGRIKMRATAVAFLVSLAGLGAGCIVQTSLHPLVADSEALAMPGIVGRWISTNDDGDVMALTFRPRGGAAYELLLSENGASRQGALRVVFGRFGGETFWDATALPLEDEDDFWGEHRLPVHGFARVRLDGDRLEIALLDPQAVRRSIENDDTALAYERTDDGILLTASSEALGCWVSAHADDDEAFGDTLVLRRVSEE